MRSASKSSDPDGTGHTHSPDRQYQMILIIAKTGITLLKYPVWGWLMRPETHTDKLRLSSFCCGDRFHQDGEASHSNRRYGRDLLRHFAHATHPAGGVSRFVKHVPPACRWTVFDTPCRCSVVCLFISLLSLRICFIRGFNGFMLPVPE